MALGAVGKPLRRVRDGYALTGKAALVLGHATMKAEAMVYTAFKPIGVPKTLAMGISPAAPRLAD